MNNEINTGGPAFPVYDNNGEYVNNGGLSLRDYFAAKAMQKLKLDGPSNFAICASLAYEMADAMIKARNK